MSHQLVIPDSLDSRLERAARLRGLNNVEQMLISCWKHGRPKRTDRANAEQLGVRWTCFKNAFMQLMARCSIVLS